MDKRTNININIYNLYFCTHAGIFVCAFNMWSKLQLRFELDLKFEFKIEIKNK
jgi:hypothetical protein